MISWWFKSHYLYNHSPDWKYPVAKLWFIPAEWEGLNTCNRGKKFFISSLSQLIHYTGHCLCRIKTLQRIYAKWQGWLHCGCTWYGVHQHWTTGCGWPTFCEQYWLATLYLVINLLSLFWLHLFSKWYTGIMYKIDTMYVLACNSILYLAQEPDWSAYPFSKSFPDINGITSHTYIYPLFFLLLKCNSTAELLR